VKGKKKKKRGRTRGVDKSGVGFQEEAVFAHVGRQSASKYKPRKRGEEKKKPKEV